MIVVVTAAVAVVVVGCSLLFVVCCLPESFRRCFVCYAGALLQHGLQYFECPPSPQDGVA